jgi:hypothetical protein
MLDEIVGVVRDATRRPNAANGTHAMRSSLSSLLATDVGNRWRLDSHPIVPEGTEHARCALVLAVAHAPTYDFMRTDRVRRPQLNSMNSELSSEASTNLREECDERSE